MGRLELLADKIREKYNTNIILRTDVVNGDLVCELNPVLRGSKTCYLGYGKTYYECIKDAYRKLESGDPKYKAIERMFFV